MMTTALSYRTILTVLLFGVLGNCEDSTVQPQDYHSDQQQPQNSSSEGDEASPSLSRSMPFYNRDYHRDYDSNYRDSYGGYNSDRKSEHESSNSNIPGSIISSTSYSIKPGSGSGTDVYMNTKPIPIIITADRGTPNSNANDYFSRYKGPTYYDNPRRPDSPYYMTNTRDDCYNNRNCPTTSQSSDDHRSYYSVLNGNLKYPDRLYPGSSRPEQTGNRRNDEIASASEPLIYDRFATFPFRVRGNGPAKDQMYPEVDGADEYKRRVTRTSTSSPGWVKLQPISHNTYDPFLPTEKQPSGNSKSDDKGKSDGQFANRIGMEISPESFAARWGWANEPSGGSRLPSWLEEYGHKYENRRPNNNPTRDEDTKNWVKLDPIPVAGVSISKWVPKGTSPSELPSTGNLIRDQANLGTKHHLWWDRPEMTVPVIKKPSQHGWGSQSTRLPSFTNKRRPEPTNSWKDVIYPDTPISATASWVESSSALKGASAYPSSFSQSNSMGWKSDTSRRPQVASWSAPGSGGGHRFNRRPTSSSNSHYPDPHATDDDPRWVLVSNTRRVTGPANHYGNRHSYRPSVDRWRDDLDLPDQDRDFEEERDMYYGAHSHRVAKNVKFDPESTRKQDEAFRKINETLHTLRPVLNHKKGDLNTSTTPTPIPTEKPVTTTVKNVAKPTPVRTSFFSSLLGDGRKFAGFTTPASTTTSKNVNGTKVVITRKPHSMKPILAAVGAGMIPATMAAVIPMMMGRRKKRDIQNERHQLQRTVEFKPVVVHNKLVFIPYSEISSQHLPTKNSQFFRRFGNGREQVDSIVR